METMTKPNRHVSLNFGLNCFTTYFLKILVLLCLFIVLAGCGPTYVLKEDVIKQYVTDVCPKFVDQMESEDMFYFQCYNGNSSQKYQDLLSTCVSCSNGRDWMLKGKKIRGLYGTQVNKDTVTDYALSVNYCVLKQYTEKTFDRLDESKQLVEECRFSLLLYVISNEWEPDNEKIFNKYYEGIIKYTTDNFPERFYCFNRPLQEMHNDIKQYEEKAISELRQYYYRSLPRQADKIFTKRYDQAFAGFVKYYIDNNYKFYSTNSLSTERKTVCEEKIFPFIEQYQPDFNPLQK